MKTILYFTITVFFLNITALHASEPNETVNSDNNKTVVTLTCSIMEPSPLKELNFHDVMVERTEFFRLVLPSTPKEAGFEETQLENSAKNEDDILRSLAPTTPKETDFRNDYPEMTDPIRALAPVTPREADF